MHIICCFRVPSFGYELMCNKLQQVSEKRDKLIAKKRMIETLMLNPDIAEEEYENILAENNCLVEQKLAADKNSLLQFPNKSLIVPLPIELFVNGHENRSQSPCLQQNGESQIEEPDLALEKSHSQIVGCPLESMNNSSLEPRLQISNDDQSSNSDSFKIAHQDHLKSEFPQSTGAVSSRKEPHKISDNQVLCHPNETEVTAITQISQTFKSLSENLVGYNQNPDMSPLHTSSAADCVPEKCTVSEKCSVNDDLSKNKTLNIGSTSGQLINKTIKSSGNNSEAFNALSSRPVKSHLKYKSVLQYKKPLSR